MKELQEKEKEKEEDKEKEAPRITENNEEDKPLLPILEQYLPCLRYLKLNNKHIQGFLKTLWLMSLNCGFSFQKARSLKWRQCQRHSYKGFNPPDFQRFFFFSSEGEKSKAEVSLQCPAEQSWKQVSVVQNAHRML